MPKKKDEKIVKHLSQQEQEIRSLVDRAGDGPPVVEDIHELSKKKEMEIPTDIKRSECAYRWLSTDNLHKETLGNKRKWEVVTRSNHSHIHPSYFGDHGAIMYGADSVLCFTWREGAEAVQKQIEREFNFAADQAINPNPQKIHGAGGKEMAIIEQVDGSKMGPAHRTDELTSDSDFDYPAPD